MADHPHRRKPRRRRPEESTQPDMEVPAEMLDAGEQLARPSAAITTPGEGGRTLMTRSPAAGRRPMRRGTPSPQAPAGMERGGASWTRQVVESGSLELELEQEIEPLGEGDGATRVISMSELGDLQHIRGMGPADMQDLPPQARTETHVMAVSMDQLEDSFNEADISNNPYQYANDALEHEVTIGPNSGIKPPQIDDYYSHSQEDLDEPIDALEESIDIVNVVDESDMEEELDPGEVTSASVGQASRPMSIRRVRRTSTGSQPRSATPAPQTSSQASSAGSASSPSLSSQEAVSAKESSESRKGNDSARGKGKSLEALANAVKKKRSQQRSTRLGVSQRAESAEDKPAEDDANQSHQERIRSIAQKARQRVEERERVESQQSLAAASDEELPGGAGARVARAQLLVAEARALMEEARELADGLDDALSLQGDVIADETNVDIDEDTPPLDPSTRREARKILEMARRLAEVEQNRLPGSTRKTIMRLVKELDKQIEDHDGSNTARLALQLANRLFETIRRDLRPW